MAKIGFLCYCMAHGPWLIIFSWVTSSENAAFCTYDGFIAVASRDYLVSTGYGFAVAGDFPY